MIEPVCDAPLLLVEEEHRVLVAADIHLGLEYELWLGGISIPSQTEHILERLKGYIKEIKPDRLILLGDVKHNIPRTSWQERREVPRFLKELSKDARVEIVPGNHDGGLADMVPIGARVQPSTGFILDGVGYFHGHTWPDKKLLSANLLVAGHIHPALRLKDPLGHSLTRRVWARMPLSSEAVIHQYGLESAPEMVVMPAFNSLCGGLPLNEISDDDCHGPIMTLGNFDCARIYLLDGTDLGPLKGIRSSQKRQG